MKKLLTIALALACTTIFTTHAVAAIDWAGNTYPNNGHIVTPTGDIQVYVQVYKGGVTDGAGQGADLSATLEYQSTTMGSSATIAMTYLGDVGNNDEYTALIPQADLAGASSVSVVEVLFSDASDGSTFAAVGDQQSNPFPLVYTVSDVTPNDIDVTFTLCMSGVETVGAPCVIGSAPEIGAWGTGVPMTNIGGELWEVTVTFAAGSNPGFEYKFKKDDCNTWEGTGNRSVTLPTDGSTSMTLDADSWEFLPIGCGLGSVLSEDKVICFQLCMEGVDNTGGLCVIGNLPELGNWSAGVSLNMLGTDVYQACITIPAGSPYPINMEYKFQKDDCGTWESIGNRMLTIDDNTASTTDLFHTFDDGPGTCTPVSDERSTFGGVKARFND